MLAVERVVIFTAAFGFVMGLAVLGAAWATANQRRTQFWLGGTVWGMLATGLVLSDCLNAGIPGPISNTAFPIFVAGVVGFPVALAWKQPRWWWRWLAAQGILLLTLAPGMLVAVVAALCTFT